jgi:hypothetical protein
MAPYILPTVLVLLVAALVVGLIAGTGAALWRWRGGWRWLAGLPLLFVLGVALKIVVYVGADPTAHNLWPFEVLGAVVLASVALGGLQLLRFLAGRWLGRKKLS